MLNSSFAPGNEILLSKHGYNFLPMPFFSCTVKESTHATLTEHERAVAGADKWKTVQAKDNHFKYWAGIWKKSSGILCPYFSNKFFSFALFSSLLEVGILLLIVFLLFSRLVRHALPCSAACWHAIGAVLLFLLLWLAIARHIQRGVVMAAVFHKMQLLATRLATRHRNSGLAAIRDIQR